MFCRCFLTLKPKVWTVNDFQVKDSCGFFSWNRGWSPKFATGLNVLIGIDQKIYEWPDVLLLKWCTLRGIILAKWQLSHSYTFWTMSKPIIVIFSPVANFGDHPLHMPLQLLSRRTFFLGTINMYIESKYVGLLNDVSSI